LGYGAAMFSSAGEFLASSKLSSTACLVADVHMPTMTGVELYCHLIDTGNLIPTILVTAYPDENMRKRMLDMGVECYLRKPLEEALFLDCIRSACTHDKRRS
jgi:FixJ family two-component response regulator